jgi:tricarboxylate carrier
MGLHDIDIDKPRWDQRTYLGRAKHFFSVTNPLNLLYGHAALERAKDIVLRHKSGQPQKEKLSVDDLYKAKTLYNSAYHPITGEKTFILGRMSAQVPCNMFIVGCMLQFHSSPAAVVFWQWFNQSFNAMVNYCNRSGATMEVDEIGKAYVAATTGAVGTALYLNKLAKSAPSLVGRLVPFAAVSAANCINVPCMRITELTEGVKIVDENNREYGKSRKAAREGTLAVVVSRVLMASPYMILTPLVMNYLDRRRTFAQMKWVECPFQVLFSGVILTFATPLACALFVQNVPINSDRLEPAIQKSAGKGKILYYNKGL